MEEKINQYIFRTDGLKERLQASIEAKERFNLNLDEIRNFDPLLSKFVLKYPS
jgi:regulator of replication initiation timing